MSQRVKKVLNSSVVLAVDEQGGESILLGRGIGYGQKPGNVIAEDATDQVFLPVGDPDARALIDLLGSIPASYVLLTREIVHRAQDALSVHLHPHLLLALTDHLHFAVQRHQEGIHITNRLAWEMRTYYAAEYSIGVDALALIQDRLGVQLPEDEAANIAFHLVNARNDPQSAFDALRAARLISEIMTIVSYDLGQSLETDDINHRRFVTHLQFFAERLFSQRLLDDEDGFLYRQMGAKYPLSMECADRVRQHLTNAYDAALPDEEVGYLCLHIQRLAGRATQADAIS